MYICMYYVCTVCRHVCLYVCIRIYVYMYVYIYICMCISADFVIFQHAVQSESKDYHHHNHHHNTPYSTT